MNQMLMWESFKLIFKQKGEIYLRIKAQPGAPQTKVKDVLEDETIKVGLKASASNNRANLELVRFLAEQFEVDRNNVKIISGITERSKLVKILK